MPASSLWPSCWGEGTVEEGPVLAAGPPALGSAPPGWFLSPRPWDARSEGSPPVSLSCCLAASCTSSPQACGGLNEDTDWV